MNDWEKEFWAVMDAVTATVEDWVEEIEQTITEVSTALEEEVSAEWEGFWTIVIVGALGHGIRNKA